MAQEVPPHSALPVVTLDRFEIDLEEHRHHPREPAALVGEEVASVDARPVERLHLPVRLEDLGRELEVALAEAVLDDVRAERPDDVGVALPEDAHAPLRDVRPLDYADGDRVLHVLADVGDYVRDAHDASLERGREHLAVEAGRLHALGEVRLQPLPREVPSVVLVHRRLDLAVVPEDSVENRQREVEPAPALLEVLQHAHGLRVVHESARAVLRQEPRELGFASVPARRVADVVSERDGLDEVLVQAQTASDGPRDPGDHLHVEEPARDVVVPDQEEHLRLVHVPRVGVAVHDAVRVVRERRPEVSALPALRGPPARRGVAAEARMLPVQHRPLDIQARLRDPTQHFPVFFHTVSCCRLLGRTTFLCKRTHRTLHNAAYAEFV